MLTKLFLRIGLSFIFIWFGIDKFVHTEAWLDHLPGFLAAQIQGSSAVYIIGSAELLIGLLLLSSLYKLMALLAGAEIAVIAVTSFISAGMSLLFVYNIGLLCMAVSLLPSEKGEVSRESLLDLLHEKSKKRKK